MDSLPTAELTQLEGQLRLIGISRRRGAVRLYSATTWSASHCSFFCGRSSASLESFSNRLLYS